MGRFIRTGTSRGAHIRALHAALLQLEELLPFGPNEKRVRLRNHRQALERAYPKMLHPDADTVAVEQHLAEEDGDAIEDAP